MSCCNSNATNECLQVIIAQAYIKSSFQVYSCCEPDVMFRSLSHILTNSFLLLVIRTIGPFINPACVDKTLVLSAHLQLLLTCVKWILTLEVQYCVMSYCVTNWLESVKDLIFTLWNLDRNADKY